MIITAPRQPKAGEVPLRSLRAVSRFILLAGGMLMLVATLLIVVEIIMRQAFRLSLGGVDEVAGFTLAIATAWSFGAVLLDKAHVRIDSLYSRFGVKTRAVLDIVSLGGTVLFVGMLVFFAVQVLTTSLRFNATSQSSLAIPKAVPQALWVAGLGWFLLVAVVLLVACLNAARRGDWGQVGRLAGAPELDEEIQAELADSELRKSEDRGGSLR